MRLGIVVPTKDRLAEVETLLRSLTNQTDAPSAVVVVDSIEARPDRDPCVDLLTGRFGEELRAHVAALAERQGYRP